MTGQHHLSVLSKTATNINEGRTVIKTVDQVKKTSNLHFGGQWPTGTISHNVYDFIFKIHTFLLVSVTLFPVFVSFPPF